MPTGAETRCAAERHFVGQAGGIALAHHDLIADQEIRHEIRDLFTGIVDVHAADNRVDPLTGQGGNDPLEVDWQRGETQIEFLGQQVRQIDVEADRLAVLNIFEGRKCRGHPDGQGIFADQWQRLSRRRSGERQKNRGEDGTSKHKVTPDRVSGSPEFRANAVPMDQSRRRAIMSISIRPPRARAVTPTVVRAGSRPVPEIRAVDVVERGIVALERGQKDTHHDDRLQPGAEAPQYTAQIVHHLVRLRLDPIGNRTRVVIRIGGELAGNEQPAVLLHSVAVWRDGSGRAADHMKYRFHVRRPLPRLY